MVSFTLPVTGTPLAAVTRTTTLSPPALDTSSATFSFTVGVALRTLNVTVLCDGANSFVPRYFTVSVCVPGSIDFAARVRLPTPAEMVAVPILAPDSSNTSAEPLASERLTAMVSSPASPYGKAFTAPATVVGAGVGAGGGGGGGVVPPLTVTGTMALVPEA